MPSIKCPKCKKCKNKIVDSRHYNDYIRRRRECKICNHRFSTRESLKKFIANKALTFSKWCDNFDIQLSKDQKELIKNFFEQQKSCL